MDVIILAVTHNAFKEITLGKLKGIMNANPILIDVRGFFEPARAREKDFIIGAYELRKYSVTMNWRKAKIAKLSYSKCAKIY